LTWEGALATNVSFLGPVIRGHSKKSLKKAEARRSDDVIAAHPIPANAPAVTHGESPDQKDYFVERNGVKFAGTHLLIDFWQADNLNNIDLIEQALRESVDACHATLLHIHLHHFSPNGGVSGVAVLAESHISIHTWPERGYAALDIFMCGACDPYNALPVLRRYFGDVRVQLGEQRRGLIL
jgi:S-adenosylmethionine decarboxylase